MTRLLAIALLAGCSNILGIEDLSGPDNNPPVDGQGGTDVPVGDRITVSLALRIFDGAAGDQPLTNTMVEFAQLPGGMRLASGASDSAGRVTLSLPTSGMPLDGVFHVAGGAFNGVPYPPTSFYPLPLVADTTTSVSILTDPFVDMFAMSFGEQRNATSAFIFVFVALPGSDTMTAQGREGIRVVGDANDRVHYDGPMGPDPTTQQTGPQGTAYIVNAVSTPVPKQLRAFEAFSDREVGARTLDVTQPRTVHFAIVPTVP